MNDHPDTPGEERSLVMPFVVCGDDGPFDSASFVAGYECGFIDEVLKSLALNVQQVGGSAKVERYIDPRLLPQVDLIAMRYGFTMKSQEPWDEHPDEWTLVTLVRGGAEEPDQ